MKNYQRIKNTFEVDPNTRIRAEEASWVTSYADMVTILLCFFMLFFKLSKMDPSVVKIIKSELQATFKKEEVSTMSPAELRKRAFKKLYQNLSVLKKVDKNIKLNLYREEMVITFGNDKYFESGSEKVVPEMKHVVMKIADILKTKGKEFDIAVEGHSDSAPLAGVLRKRWGSNWTLSSARSAKIVEVFLDKGISPERLSAVGYADSRPVIKDKDAFGQFIYENMAVNRRVEIRLKKL